MRSIILPAFSLLLVAGCAEGYLYRRQGMWQPEGANAANLAAMVQRPADLLRGRGDPVAERREAADAVKRLWEDRQRPWPGKSATTATTSTSSQGGS